MADDNERRRAARAVMMAAEAEYAAEASETLPRVFNTLASLTAPTTLGGEDFIPARSFVLDHADPDGLTPGFDIVLEADEAFRFTVNYAFADGKAVLTIVRERVKKAEEE